MNLPQYPLLASNDFKQFDFISEGPNGRILKTVLFTPIEPCFYNLGFGDRDPETGDIDDLAVSNNGDTAMILATVALAVMEFTIHFPQAWVYAKGSTPTRTRLYPRGIRQNWSQIEPFFYVRGFASGHWRMFDAADNYDAFLVMRK